ncbi:hypothetical protein [Listeria valentina]|nr:hypothetical protein [Listeria valentina]
MKINSFGSLNDEHIYWYARQSINTNIIYFFGYEEEIGKGTIPE